MIRSCNARTVPIWRSLGADDLPGGVQRHCLPSLSSGTPPDAEPGAGPEMPATIRADEIVGRWGLASFQNPNDRARTEPRRGQCKQPYVIGAGQTRRRRHASG